MKNFSFVKQIIIAWLFALVLPTGAALADEGMWLPIYLKIVNEQAMQDLGMKLTTDQIYSINKASLKDAVVQFGGGCTGEIISPEGLILTNHHCGYSYVLQHSTVQQNYLKAGFWAGNHAEEKPCPGLNVSILVRMEDVTQRVLEGIPPGASEADREAKIVQSIEKIKKEAVAGTHYKAFVRPFYYGSEYYLFVNEVFTDVRLVGAPPSSIGKFGGDTDNWMWPRHTGDFSLFRIYSGPDNLPAPYSKDNIPYRPKTHFQISLDGIKENDFTLVLGYPGRTQEYLSSHALRMIEKESNAFKIALRTKRLALMAQEMAKSDSMRIRYAGRYASIANAWKKWMGENNGLKRLNADQVKEKQETEFQKWVDAEPARKKEYGKVISQLKAAYDTLSRIILPVEYQREAVFGNDILQFTSSFGAIMDLAGGPKADPKAWDALRERTTQFFKVYNPNLDRPMLSICLQAIYKDIRPEYRSPVLTEMVARNKGNFTNLTADIFKKSAFTDEKRSQKLINALQNGKTKKLDSDPLYQLWRDFNYRYENRLLPAYNRLNAVIDENLKLYVEGLRKINPEKNFYPDANLTFRVAYGKVAGYSPRDGVNYRWLTTLNGVMEKEDTTEEFQVHPRLKELYEARNYGMYSVGDTMPLAFTASNHTTGGNSGSPVINANGQLIGTNFDRNWEGTMSDLMYDPAQCRNIALDIRYTLFIIDKFAEAKHLVREMSIIKNGKLIYLKP